MKNADELLQRIKHLKEELKRDDLRPQDRITKQVELRAAIRKLYDHKEPNYHMWE